MASSGPIPTLGFQALGESARQVKGWLASRASARVLSRVGAGVLSHAGAPGFVADPRRVLKRHG
jgi:hypothetical protein